MEKDSLRTFNVALAAEFKEMDDEQLWSFIQSQDAVVKEWIDTKNFPQTGVFFAYNGGPEHYRKHFLSEIDDCRDGVIYTMILDFCLGREKVPVGYRASSGYLDSANSCRVETSDDIMPIVEDEECLSYQRRYFHLLEARHLDDMINAMENNAGEAADDCSSDIAEIKRMREFCLNNAGYKVAFTYDIATY